MSENESSGAKIKRVMLDNGQLVVTGTRNLEYELVVSLNHETAKKIMETAGIDKTNPNYKAYYAQAMAAAHHSRRFNGDEEAMIKLFAEEMQKPDMTPEKLKNFERSYRNYILEQQQKYASGSTFDNRDESAQTIDKNIQETVRSGVELRKKINPTFPDIMYDNGLLTDVVLDLSSEARETSALGIINSTVDKYNKYGMIFDAESNQFQVKGKPVKVQKFYISKKNQMDKFLANLEKNGGFDASDKELFEVIEAGDYQKFLELKKQRGGQDKRNMFLRNALNDEILFDRFSEEIKGKEHSLDNITETAKILSEDYGSKSDIISKESERGKITSASTGDLKAGEIDRIVFSAKPFQVASQSTYQNWKSCMNAVGLNHHYVDDSIGQGSIVAYGYNSKNPQNKISRLLIHPWINEKGETLYVVNDRIYGESNSAFQNSVKAFTESLNQGKEGVFMFNTNAFPSADGLYNDNSGKNTILRKIAEKDIDFRQMKNLELSDVDLSQAKSIKFPKNISLNNVVLGDNLDFNSVENLSLQRMDLSKTKLLNSTKNVSLNAVVLGDNLDFSHTENLKLSFIDLSKIQAQFIELAGNVKLDSVRIDGSIDFSKVNSLELSGTDLSKAETIKFPKSVKFQDGLGGYRNKLGPNVDFSSTENLELTNVDLSKTKSVKFPENVKLSSNIQLGDNVDFSQIKNLEISNVDLSKYKNIKFPENVKLDGVTLGDNVDFSQIKNLEISNVDLSKYENIKFPENVKLDRVTLGDNVDFSQIKNLELSNVDLTKYEDIKFPENVKFGHDTKLGGNLDFSNIKNLDLSNVDLSKAKSVKFPQNVKFGYDTKLGGNLDFSQVKNLELYDIDLSKAEAVKFPEEVKFDFAAKLRGNLDFSNIKNLDLSSVDLSEAKSIKFPENVKLGYGTNLNDNIDLSSVKNIEIPDLGYIDKFNISNDTNIKLGRDVEIRKKEDLNTLKRCDTSETKTIFFDEKILSEVKDAGMEFPANKVLIFERDGKAVIVCDEKSRNELIKDFQIEENKIDFISPEEFCQKEGVKFEKTDNRASNDNGPKQQETIAKENTNQIEAETEKLMANKQANENTSDLKKTLKQQADKNVEVQSKTTSNLKETLQTQAKSNGSLGSKVSAVSNGVDNVLEKAGNKLNDNALGRAINKADSWRPHNKTAAKVMDKVGAVPVAAVVASGVSAYEQYKSGDKKGAAATFGKGVVHASVQGVATSAGMNIAAKGASKAAEKVTEKVVARQAAKAASKQVAKAAGKAAGKAVGKSVLKKIPLVSLGAGAYFAYERAKNGEWGKAGCELLSGALGCFPGVGTVASTAVDCGLAVADTKQAINETKKQQAQQQRQAQKSPEQIKQEQKKKAEMAKKAEELRNTKVGQKKAANTNNKTIEKSLMSRIKNAVFSR